MVENEPVTGSLASRHKVSDRYNGHNHNGEIPPTPSEYQREMQMGSDNDEGGGGGGGGGGGSGFGGSTRAPFERSASARIREERKGKVGSEGGQLYAEFMRNGGADGFVEVEEVRSP